MTLPVQGYVDDKGFEGYQVLEKITLNYFDVKANSNKFYTLEIHEAKGRYRLFSQYGRVGAAGRKEVRFPSGLWEAQSEFSELKRQKTAKGYVEVALAQATTGSELAQSQVDVTEVKPTVANVNIQSKSQLDPAIQEFVAHIYDEAGSTLRRLVSGVAKSDGGTPLGKLTVGQIQRGRYILQEIADYLARHPNATPDDVLRLSEEFFRLIPRAFGRYVTVADIALNTQARLNQELDILQFYEDSLKMDVGLTVTDEVDKKYEALHTDFGLVLPSDPNWKRIADYVKKSESNHHGVHLEVKRIFTVRQKKAPRLDNSVGNIKELFHGSRTANLPSIFSSHLKLPSHLQGVQLTGAMFGPGIYFADQSTKSSQYAMARFSGGNGSRYRTAFLLLADVALGKIKEERNAAYHTAPPRGYDSVKGVAGASLLHNEYIVYRENQQKLRYAVEFQAHSRY